ncbi:MAG: fibronectin type III domain-containing protein [Ignavibacteriaceae bacterium]
MNRTLNIFIQLVIILFLSHSLLFAQYGNPIPGHVPSKERGDPKYRTHTQIEGNRVRASIFNFAFTGREGGQFPIDVQTPYEWPKNTGEVYLALTGLFLGAEVTDNKGQIQHIIDVPDYRTSPDGKSWNLEPIPGYSNPNSNSLANSLDPDTWPSFWPDKLGDKTDPGWKGKWNGYFGKNIFNADQELFAKASDDRYDRYTDYFPDTTDLTRKGLGIIVDQRTLAWSQILIQDDVFLLYTLRNDGTKDIPKMGVTIWFADFVGGNGDSQDDIADFDILGRFLWSRDADNRAPTFGADPVGAVALTFLETPGNSFDRIDNDGDGEANGPKVTEDMLQGEIPDNGIDDNGNGLIDENMTDVPFGTQKGTTFADGIDNNNNGEESSPVVTQAMIDEAANDKWHRWPPNPETDSIQQGQVWLIEVTQSDLGLKYKDNIDNNNNSYNDLPKITQEMIGQAAKDKYHRYKVPGTHVILYNLYQSSLGKGYLNKDGLRDAGVDENIDEMIDESRTDKVDNDGDWNPLTDDVGLDGIPDTHDVGEGDGKPTSGVGTGEPGEPHIDLTDVKETDQIGITNAQRIAAGGLNINSDATMWFDFMIPGKYFNPAEVKPGEYDLFVSSGLFPMPAGDVQPFSMAVILVNGPINDPGWTIRRNEVLKKRQRAQETYQNNYRFAIAPPAPTLTAVPGNNRVTLYWDSAPENSYDAFTAHIGGDGHHFEGYRIYRSSDPAFQDALTITNGEGTPQFMSPIAIFDLKDGIKGYDSLGIDGIHYNLGNDSGLQHSFVDSTAKNGFTYYYAVVSYSKGFASGGILPAESPIRVNLKADGSVELGPNVARVTPEAPSSGYVNSTLGNIKLVQGATTSTVSYGIVDPKAVKSGHKYYLTFQDTLITAPGVPDTLTTKNYTLVDSTDNRTLIYQNPYLSDQYEQPIIDGFRLKFNNAPSVKLDDSSSKWNDPNIPPFTFEKFVAPGGISGELRPDDYKVFFGNVGMDTSVNFTYAGTTFPAEPVNFRVLNTTTNKYLKFGFLELDQTGGKGKFSAKGSKKDRIVFLEPNSKDSLVVTWWFYLSSEPDTSKGQTNPMPGDTAYIKLKKPFLSNDIFSFTSATQYVDKNLARVQLDNIKVVPNPYLASARWENKNPYTSGRGPRSLHFTHLPANCTIRIFTVDGELVKTIEHNSAIDDGTEEWNMLSKDNLSIAYGVYVFDVDAPGIGSKIGKFAVIK